MPTGSPALDEALGGGFRGGRVYVVSGHAGSGKTQLAMSCAARQLICDRTTYAISVGGKRFDKGRVVAIARGLYAGHESIDMDSRADRLVRWLRPESLYKLLVLVQNIRKHHCKQTLMQYNKGERSVGLIVVEGAATLALLSDDTVQMRREVFVRLRTLLGDLARALNAVVVFVDDIYNVPLHEGVQIWRRALAGFFLVGDGVSVQLSRPGMPQRKRNAYVADLGGGGDVSRIAPPPFEPQPVPRPSPPPPLPQPTESCPRPIPPPLLPPPAPPPADWPPLPGVVAVSVGPFAIGDKGIIPFEPDDNMDTADAEDVEVEWPPRNLVPPRWRVLDGDALANALKTLNNQWLREQFLSGTARVPASALEEADHPAETFDEWPWPSEEGDHLQEVIDKWGEEFINHVRGLFAHPPDPYPYTWYGDCDDAYDDADVASVDDYGNALNPFMYEGNDYPLGDAYESGYEYDS